MAGTFKSIAGKLTVDGLRFGIVVSRFNSFITDRLLAGAMDALTRAGATAEQVNVVQVPGAFEIPIAAKKMAQTGKFDAVICIGCVLRGETTHYDYVCSEAARGKRRGAEDAEKAQRRPNQTAQGPCVMALRRKSREFALQMLYQWDQSGQKSAHVESRFWKEARAEASTRKFANQLFEGAISQAAELDKIIKQHAKNWRIERIAVIDKNILRLGIYELRSGSDVPAKVVIYEAIELAKKYSTEESAPFINGILDAILKEENGKRKMEKGT
ncbi:MAG: transcription antitermination factor NusB [Acidobacteria bacterium]|nr:transcription antitermination factor NusB [Acidobacteriota bacterium]